MPLTEQERLAWQRAYERAREDERRRCTSPISPANPVRSAQPVYPLR